MIRSLCVLMAAAFVPMANAGVDSGLVSLLPAGTQMVFNINVQESRTSQFGRFLLKDMRWSDAKLQEMMVTTGFDPRRDLVTLLVAAPERGQTTGHENNFLVLARGNFDSAKIGATALQRGWTRQNLSGSTVYVETGKQKQSTGFSFLDVDLAVMGDLAQVQQVIANRTNPARIDPDLDRLVNNVSSEHDVWFASVGSPDRLAAAVGPDQSQNAGILRSISQSSGGIKFGDAVQFSFDAITKSDKDATSLADVVRFLASAAQMKRDQDPNAAFLAPALDNLKLTSSGNTVQVATSLPEDSLEALATQMHGRSRLQAPRN